MPVAMTPNAQTDKEQQVHAALLALKQSQERFSARSLLIRAGVSKTWYYRHASPALKASVDEAIDQQYGQSATDTLTVSNAVTHATVLAVAVPDGALDWVEAEIIALEKRRRLWQSAIAEATPLINALELIRDCLLLKDDKHQPEETP